MLEFYLWRLTALEFICRCICSVLFCAIVICSLLIWRHKENIAKLVNGTESKIGAKKDTANTAADECEGG